VIILNAQFGGSDPPKVAKTPHLQKGKRSNSDATAPGCLCGAAHVDVPSRNPRVSYHRVPTTFLIGRTTTNTVDVDKIWFRKHLLEKLISFPKDSWPVNLE